MNLIEDRSYSVLLVSSSEKVSSSFTSVLTDSYHDPIVKVSSVAAAERVMLERLFDIVVINSPLSDDIGTKFAINTSSNKTSAVLMLIKAENEEEIRNKVVPFGIFTLPKPTTSIMLSTAIRWMESARESLRSFENKTLSIEEKMKEIRTVNRAKWLLIENLRMTESEAHRYIEKQAMDRCITKMQFAKNIIKTYQ